MTSADSMLSPSRNTSSRYDENAYEPLADNVSIDSMPPPSRSLFTQARIDAVESIGSDADTALSVSVSI